MTTLEEAMASFDAVTEDALRQTLESTKAELEKLKAAATKLPLLEELVKTIRQRDQLKGEVEARITALKQQ